MINMRQMNYKTGPSIQDVIDRAKRYVDQGISRDEAISRAIAISTSMLEKTKPRA